MGKENTSIYKYNKKQFKIGQILTSYGSGAWLSKIKILDFPNEKDVTVLVLEAIGNHRKYIGTVTTFHSEALTSVFDVVYTFDKNKKFLI